MKRQSPVHQVSFAPRPVREEVYGSRWDIVLFVIGMLAIVLAIALLAPGGAA